MPSSSGCPSGDPPDYDQLHQICPCQSKECEIETRGRLYNVADAARERIRRPDPLGFAFGFFAAGDGNDLFKISRPASSSDVPSRTLPELRSMSSIIRSYIGVFVATLIVGAGLLPEATPPSGGEDDDVASSGNESRDGDRIVARRVHEAEPLLPDGFGVIVDSSRGACPPLAMAPSDF